MPSIIYDINGNDWGLGMDLPGKKLEIIMKNINPLVDARIVKGYILNNIPFNSSVVNAPFSGVELAIMCLPVSQNYNGVHNSYTATYDIPYPNTSINGVPLSTFNGYNLNHRFVKNFTLRPFSAYGDHFVFDVFFFPMVSRSYEATLFVEYEVNGASYNFIHKLHFNGVRYGNVSEIDQTSFDLVFEIDFAGSDGVLMMN